MNNEFLLIAHHGAAKILPENTLASCRYAVQEQGANALEVDVCLTRDDQIVLWHDWDPNDTVSLMRQMGLQPDNLYRPSVPDFLDGLRRPVHQLTLNQLRRNYTYEPNGELPDVPGATNPDLEIPTLAELARAAMEWPTLRYLIVDLKLPEDSSTRLISKIMRLIWEAIPGGAPYQILLMTPYQRIVKALKKYMADSGLSYFITWDRELPPGLISEPMEYSALDSALYFGNAIASVGRPTSATLAPFETYQSVISYDTEQWNNPATRNSIQHLIAWTINDPAEMEWLIRAGVSGILTDDIPALKTALTRLGKT